MLSSSSSIIVNALLDAAHRRPDGWAVRDPDVSMSYPDLVARVEQEADGLATAGLAAGESVMITATHSVDYLVAYFACLHLACRLLPHEPEAPQAEAEREVARHAVRFTLRPGQAPARSRLAPTGAARSEGSQAPCVCLPTSGTSGLPKRAVHREERLLGNARAHAASIGLSERDTAMVSLSPAFGYCHTAQILAAVARAARLVFPPRPALPSELGAVLEAFGVTTTTMVPHQLGDPMLRALGRGGSLRQLVLGGSAVTDELTGRIREILPGTEYVQTWGMTEAGPRLTTWRSGRDSERPGSVGTALDGVEIVAANEDGTVPLAGLPAGFHAHPAELVVRTPYLMTGYLDAPEQTAQAVPADGVLRTGDLGRVDSDGYVYLTGRIKNLIDVGGKKVSPEEIEEVLLALPGVAQARVSAAADPRRGQQPAAEVVLEPGALLTGDEVRAYACSQLARHKWLKNIEIVEMIDRTRNGKIRRW